MRGSENYQDFKKKIHLYFDNELDNCDCENLMNKVENDPKCRNMFHKEKNFREYVKNHIKRPTVSSSLLSSIRNCIKVED